MKVKKFVLVILFLCLSSSFGFDIKELIGNRELTPKVIVPEVLKYFQQDDPRGIPVINLPERIGGIGPFVLPAPLSFKVLEAEFTGHSGIKLEYVNVNLTSLQLDAKIGIPHIFINGTFEQVDWWGYPQENDFNISIESLEIDNQLFLGVDHSTGHFQLIETEVEITTESFNPVFENLGGLASVTVSAADTLWGSVFAPVASDMISDTVKDKANAALQKRLKDKRFPADISPVDFLVATHRHKIDNIIKKPQNKTINLTTFMSLELKNIDVEGLSTLHRTREISTVFVDNKFYFTVQLGTQDLEASTDFELYAYIVPVKSGHLNIHIDSIAVTVEAMQDANVKHPPVLRNIDIHLGNFGIYSSDNGAVDYILEATANIAPNVFRNVIMDIVERRLHEMIQRRLSSIDVESIIMKYVNKM